jgi:hypothetical protein
MKNLIVFRHTRARDPDGTKLGGTVEAHLASEHARGLRQRMMHVVAFTSVPVALIARWPAPPGLRWIAFGAWMVAVAGVVVAAVSEWKYRRERAQLMMEMEPLDRRTS